MNIDEIELKDLEGKWVTWPGTDVEVFLIFDGEYDSVLQHLLRDSQDRIKVLQGVIEAASKKDTDKNRDRTLEALREIGSIQMEASYRAFCMTRFTNFRGITVTQDGEQVPMENTLDNRLRIINRAPHMFKFMDDYCIDHTKWTVSSTENEQVKSLSGGASEPETSDPTPELSDEQSTTSDSES